jgi:arginyl-tRNA synthetase
MNSKTIELHLRNITKKILKKDYGRIASKIVVKRNANLSLGDYSSNILFLIAKIKKTTPNEAFDLLKPRIEKIKSIAKIEFAQGYLNFFLDKKVFVSNFKNILQKGISAFTPRPIFGVGVNARPKVILDYVSANPTGPLTLGNARGAVIGDCLKKILKLRGLKTMSEYYVNDRGTQIDILGKSILALADADSRGQKADLHGQENENLYRGEYLKEIKSKIQIPKSKMNNMQAIGKMAADVILEDYIKKSLENFETKFDNYFYETSLYADSRGLAHGFTRINLNKKVLGILKKKGFITERDGAVWLLLTKIGEAKDEVIMRSNGEYTYFWSDVLYHYHKFFIRKSSALLIVAADHLDHTRRLRAVFEKIFRIKPEDFRFIVYQMVHLIKDDELVKMAKRKGIYVALGDLVKEVGLDPVRFFFLKYAAETTVKFDLELAKKQSEENPIWYLHYGYVRLKKILEKANASKFLSKEQMDIAHRRLIRPPAQGWSASGGSEADGLILGLARPTFGRTPCSLVLRNALRDIHLLLNNPNYLLLFRKIHQFQDLIYEVARDLRPNLLPEYFLELAKIIHNFYEKEPILSDRGQPRTLTRTNADAKIKKPELEIKLLFIVYLMRILELGFYLIGIEPREEL